ncbi:DUF362 domain-containing protein [Methanolobus profundi]|nr:4Fe-4S binding protein [Methanolobus profundi]
MASYNLQVYKGIFDRGPKAYVAFIQYSSSMEEREGFIVSLGCRKCGRCENVCPNGALYRVNGFANVDHEKCDLCMKCVKICPNKALVYME